MDVLDVDTRGCCIVLEDDLLQEHEGALVLCMLPHLHEHDNVVCHAQQLQQQPMLSTVFLEHVIDVVRIGQKAQPCAAGIGSTPKSTSVMSDMSNLAESTNDCIASPKLHLWYVESQHACSRLCSSNHHCGADQCCGKYHLRHVGRPNTMHQQYGIRKTYLDDSSPCVWVGCSS